MISLDDRFCQVTFDPDQTLGPGVEIVDPGPCLAGIVDHPFLNQAAVVVVIELQLAVDEQLVIGVVLLPAPCAGRARAVAERVVALGFAALPLS